MSKAKVPVNRIGGENSKPKVEAKPKSGNRVVFHEAQIIVSTKVMDANGICLGKRKPMAIDVLANTHEQWDASVANVDVLIGQLQAQLDKGNGG